MFSYFSALKPFIIRIPPSVSVKRPVTSDSIIRLCLKIGLIFLKAKKEMTPNINTGTKTYNVNVGLMLINKIKETIDVKIPPTSCTKPVPIILRTPSTSFITLETKAPVLLLSKKLMGSDNNFF